MAKKRKRAAKPAPQQVTGTTIANCNFSVQAPLPEPLANVERKVEAVKAIAEAARSTADALSKAADALAGPAVSNDNTCIKIGAA